MRPEITALSARLRTAWYTSTAMAKDDRRKSGPAGPRGSTGACGPVGPRGLAGPRGPRGHRGSLGPQGVIGPTGARGKTGDTGKAGSSPSGDQLLAAEINRHIEDIYKALDIQMKRMGQMQV